MGWALGFLASQALSAGGGKSGMRRPETGKRGRAPAFSGFDTPRSHRKAWNMGLRLLAEIPLLARCFQERRWRRSCRRAGDLRLPRPARSITRSHFSEAFGAWRQRVFAWSLTDFARSQTFLATLETVAPSAQTNIATSPRLSASSSTLFATSLTVPSDLIHASRDSPDTFSGSIHTFRDSTEGRDPQC